MSQINPYQSPQLPLEAEPVPLWQAEPAEFGPVKVSERPEIRAKESFGLFLVLLLLGGGVVAILGLT